MTELEIINNQIKYLSEQLSELKELEVRIKKLEEHLSTDWNYVKDTPWLDSSDTSLSKRNSM